MRQNPHVRICGGPGSAMTLVYPTAVGRELLGFIWAIGTTVETAAGPDRSVAA